MRPDARIAAAIEILHQWLDGGRTAERILADWGRANRYAGSSDRRAIGDLVYDAIRRKRSSAWLGGAETARGIMIGALRQAGAEIDRLFSGERHAPARLDSGEGDGSPLDTAPWGVRVDLPDWLEPLMSALPVETLEGLRSRAPLDLRVNRLKADLDAALTALAEDGISAIRLPDLPDALRVTEAAHRVQRCRAYTEGLVEIQDAASQTAARFAGARAGETILDFCAGGGGKSLAFAALTGNEARIFAHDASAARLAQLPERAARAGAEVQLLAPGQTGEMAGRCDLVLVDAPCSGSGAWRRNPEAKWTFTPERLAELTALQAQILAEARCALRPGGRLVYLTCSLLEAENGAQVEAFLDAAPGLHLDEQLHLTDLSAGDGFFAGRLLSARG
ncbi:RsmB/NOP family class I SAM-dependent RNA methyltransferase [Rhodobacteraceae bacterium NNCM2]|nr:RsmB/NOP family class I SAM-dependent RNA methyltransferase [Coraliihabitans acroporae]